MKKIILSLAIIAGLSSCGKVYRIKILENGTTGILKVPQPVTDHSLSDILKYGDTVFVKNIDNNYFRLDSSDNAMFAVIDCTDSY